MARDPRDEEIATLREEVRQLKALLGPQGAAVYPGLMLTRGDRRLLDILMETEGTCANEWLAEQLDMTVLTLKTAICRLRPKLPVEIVTVWGEGVYIADIDKRRLTTMKETSNAENEHRRTL